MTIQTPLLDDTAILRARLADTKRELRECMHALAMVVLASGGRVEVPVRVMEDFSPGGEIVTWTDPLTRARVVTVRQ